MIHPTAVGLLFAWEEGGRAEASPFFVPLEHARLSPSGGQEKYLDSAMAPELSTPTVPTPSGSRGCCFEQSCRRRRGSVEVMHSGCTAGARNMPLRRHGPERTGDRARVKSTVLGLAVPSTGGGPVYYYFLKRPNAYQNWYG